MVTDPRDALLGSVVATSLPVCDHYCGVRSRMLKSLALQAELMQEFGACVFDVTLDCEDGAPVGGEREHALMVAELLDQTFAGGNPGQGGPDRRVAVRVHPVDHPAFEQDVQIVVGQAGQFLCHVMVPKVDSVSDVDQAAVCIDQASQGVALATPLPIHVLVESPLAVANVKQIAAHSRVESVSLGLMDFVSAHGGAIPASAMGVAACARDGAIDQFSHPMVVRAKLELSSACHAYGKTPSHGVVTEFRDLKLVHDAARRAARLLGFTRMWSIHPDQIRPILSAFAPDASEVTLASRIICDAQVAQWAPISVDGQLHDRASYRYYWRVLEKAQQTGRLAVQDPAHQFFVH
ncbi:MAG: aldolase/citrate lyase family protein [Rhodoferax sp.]|nr:aldolase/citrate lyase family protein [Rhodoferax sp.]